MFQRVSILSTRRFGTQSSCGNDHFWNGNHGAVYRSRQIDGKSRRGKCTWQWMQKTKAFKVLHALEVLRLVQHISGHAQDTKADPVNGN